MHFDNVSVLLNSVAALLSVLIIGLAYMKKVFKKYLDIYSQGKSDKNGIFDVVTSYSIFDEYIFSNNTFQCLVIKISISA